MLINIKSIQKKRELHIMMKLIHSILVVIGITSWKANEIRGAHICDTYTTALFTNNTGANQLRLMTEVVNLAVLGDPNKNVPGILAPEGNLVSFFNGAGPTTNRNGSPVTINFLDGGSNQNVLLNHLYQFFGALLGCNATGFPAYGGVPSMFEAHRFMFVNKTQNDYFIAQVGLSATALGVSSADVAIIAALLDRLFNTRCPKVLSADDGVPSFLIGSNPSVCRASTCPLDPDPDPECAAIEEEEPMGFFARLFARIRRFFANLFG